MELFTHYVPAAWDESFVMLSTGIRMAYTVCGPETGPAVVLLHGVTDGRLAWVRIAPELAARGLRVFAPEMRGNGLTDKPSTGPEGYSMDQHAEDIISFLDALGLEQIHLIGHSMGSLVAQRINLRIPHRLLSTVLIDSTACCLENPVLNWMLHGDGDTFAGVEGFRDSQIPEEFLRIWANAPMETPEFQEGMVAHLKQIPYYSWEALLAGLIHFDNRDHLSNISGRVLVLWGDQDDTFPESDQNLLVSGLTGCQLTTHIIKGAGHDVMRDTPEARQELIDMITNHVLTIH